MLHLRFSAFLVLVSALNCAGDPWARKRDAANSGLVNINLAEHLNNRAFGAFPGDADFDGSRQSYPAQSLSSNGSFKSRSSGVDYLLPATGRPDASDNVVCLGQTIAVSPDKYFSAQLLIASDRRDKAVTKNVTFTYSDNSSTVAEVRAEPWWAFLTLHKGEIILPYRYTSNDTDWNTTHIHEYTAPLEYGKTLTSISLPTTSNATTGRLHVFAVSLRQADGVQVQHVRPTQKEGESNVQLVEVTVGNGGPEWIHGDGIQISIDAPGIETVQAAHIKRLRPGDQKKVNVGVVGSTDSTVSATVHLRDDNEQDSFQFPGLAFGFKNFTKSPDSLALHESPEWFNDAKFGIFIHWGVYSVPAWGNSTPYEVYAEWHWWYSHNRAADKADVYDYDLRTYGPDTVYDDFFQNFTAEHYNASEWVDLIAAAGAQYFVITSKHHDGFALFDTQNTSQRNAVHHGPGRDVLRELFDAAAARHPHLRRGTYFSLPEWFNPDFGPYGFTQTTSNASTSWLGMQARNPYTGALEPYTGRVPVGDFVADVLLPQQEQLAYIYNTSIMWCDCGAANSTAEFASRWFNSRRDVAMNARCGLPHTADFDTPEYATLGAATARKWEANRGLDPYSYGYNRATPDAAYMNASTVVAMLVDVVAKNGNLLLDIGPRADGTVPEVQARALRGAGGWIERHSSAVVGARYWFVAAEAGVGGEGAESGVTGVRFTQTDDAFYVFFMGGMPVPGREIVVQAAVPVLPGDRGVMLGEAQVGEEEEEEEEEIEVEIKVLEGTGWLSVRWPEEMEGRGEWCWVLKVEYRA
ncbi:glycoside hydrolase family 29 protein [Aplosporella prunicola CBS 121167]|uniref:alpha-L-fucosidase n=1 Tax=Aplosporella prunicola CBS 121167 TaxID=1176127 RepID=A0A6A6B5M4_9PEZI|nr:glycoside hydrolase family 29 protein [Aplosporella prunicola CBS 121167]KAF2139442.1 glycoside hydrolase family 29 protein [Aplosporella prunicola CBS 121167]